MITENKTEDKSLDNERIKKLDEIREKLNKRPETVKRNEVDALEKELMGATKSSEEMRRELAYQLLDLWNIASLLHKKEGDYRESLVKLKKVNRLEQLLECPPLEQASTHLNMGTCLHFLKEHEMAINEAGTSRDILVQELKRSELAKVTSLSAHDNSIKKKLALNLVLTYFNRAVHYFQSGDLSSHKLNAVQALELATQRFGPDEAITQMIRSLSAKPPQDQKPFFVNKSTEPSKPRPGPPLSTLDLLSTPARSAHSRNKTLDLHVDSRSSSNHGKFSIHSRPKHSRPSSRASADLSRQDRLWSSSDHPSPNLPPPKLPPTQLHTAPRTSPSSVLPTGDRTLHLQRAALALKYMN
jgi:tetratricopeptide (TPR) repeat protein